MLPGTFARPAHPLLRCASIALACGLALPAFAQGGRQLTTADYAQAEKMMAYNVNGLVSHTVDRPTWLEDDRFWYRDTDGVGVTYTLVDPAKGTKGPAFDHAKLAAALAATGGRAAGDAQHLQLTGFTLLDGDRTVVVETGGRRLRCDLAGSGSCKPTDAPATTTGGARARKAAQVLSPDKRKAAFIRDWNLWVRDVASGKETQLTTDGVPDFGYATDNAGWTHSDNAILLWSPDSKKIATFQQDQRKTGFAYLVPTTNSHPKLEAWRYPMVGDKDVTMIERVVIEVDHPRVIRLKMPPDQHRSTLCDDITCRGGGWDDVQWSPDASHLAFVSTSRDHRTAWLRLADARTGDIREVYTETAPKFYESGNGAINWRYLPASNEFLWFSERDNWGQMYLYDLATGKLKNQITAGDGNVTQLLHVDEKNRRLYFIAVGKEKGRDPYFQHLYTVGFDGQGMQLLTPANADHLVSASPSGRFFLDVASTATEPQVSVVRDATGKQVVEVARQDISRLTAVGWGPPVPIKVMGRDGKTPVYGYMFKPSHFDPTKKYPIVNNVYPGPQTGSCGSRGFNAAHRDLQALAELGFITVCIDGMGTPWRSKSFHEAYYGNLGDNTIPDQISGMKDLAQQYSFIDLERVGIYGHSGGGNATGAAMLHFPDFFKVGIAESGNHDQRDYEDDWAEKWAGVEVKQPDGKSNYDSQANQNFAANLKGHLLLAHGTMDDNVPPNNTLLLVDALIKANKDFDLLMIPNVQHGYGVASQYMARRRWDYFVRYLAGDIPPENYQMKPYAAVLAAMGGPDAEEEQQP